jgi:hypothetical protein
MPSPNMPPPSPPFHTKDLTIKTKNDDNLSDETRRESPFFTTKLKAALLGPWEREMLTILGDGGSAKLTAQKLNTKPGHIYQRLRLIRQKDAKSYNYTKDLDDFRNTYPKL